MHLVHCKSIYYCWAKVKRKNDTSKFSVVFYLPSPEMSEGQKNPAGLIALRDEMV